MEIVGLLFAGFHPNEIFDYIFSVDFAELLIVFGTIVVGLAGMVAFGNWWSR
jgi:hypothetical protein